MKFCLKANTGNGFSPMLFKVNRRWSNVNGRFAV